MTVVIDVSVGEDFVEPGAEVGPRLELIKGFPRFSVDFAEKVFGSLPLPGHAHGGGEEFIHILRRLFFKQLFVRCLAFHEGGHRSPVTL